MDEPLKESAWDILAGHGGVEGQLQGGCIFYGISEKKIRINKIKFGNTKLTLRCLEMLLGQGQEKMT